VDSRCEWSCIVHRSVLKEVRHGSRDRRSVAGWLSGCIHCIVEPVQASGRMAQNGSPRTFLGVGGSTAVLFQIKGQVVQSPPTR